eukprot:1152933-Pelagomonas_calceolata.AAC.3
MTHAPKSTLSNPNQSEELQARSACIASSCLFPRLLCLFPCTPVESTSATSGRLRLKNRGCHARLSSSWTPYSARGSRLSPAFVHISTRAFRALTATLANILSCVPKG